MATNIPPHNLGEVIDACVALIDDPGLGIEDLINIIQDRIFRPEESSLAAPGFAAPIRLAAAQS